MYLLLFFGLKDVSLATAKTYKPPYIEGDCLYELSQYKGNYRKLNALERKICFICLYLSLQLLNLDTDDTPTTVIVNAS